METTMYLPHVYERWERNTGVAPRTVQPSLAEAQAVLDAEQEVGKPPLAWRKEFGGATAEVDDLIYEVMPVVVDLPDRPGDGDLAMVCDAYGLPHSAVALGRHLANNAQATIDNWKAVAEIAQRRLAAVQALAEEWETPANDGGPQGYDYYPAIATSGAARRLRAALDAED